MFVPVKILDDSGFTLQTCTVSNSTWDGNSESFSNTDLRLLQPCHEKAMSF